VLRLVGGAFARPANYREVLNRFAGRRLLIVCAGRGHGRSAAALRLLLDHGHTTVVGFRADVPLDSVAMSIRAGAGHVIDGMSDSDAGRRASLTLNDVDAKLRDVGARLVIPVATGTAFVDPRVRDFVVNLGAPPAHRDVLAAHLRHYLGADAEALLRDAALAALFEQEVAADSPMARAADFAAHVQDLFRRGRLSVDVLRVRLKSSVVTEVGGWFAGLPDLATRCFAVALALFDGLPYSTVAAAADSFTRRLTPSAPPGTALQQPAGDPFDSPRTPRVALVRAQVTSAQVMSRVGLVPADVVRYLDPAYPRAVIDLVWRDYDRVHRELLGWLADLGDHPDEAVRIRTATAIGLMATSSFNDVYRRVLLPWATSTSDNKRDMAAYALRGPGTRSDLNGQVLRLVDEWTRGTSWQLRAAAARVYGSALGTVHFGRALRELNRLVVTDDADVAFAIGYSLAELIDADHEQASTIVDLTVRWMRDHRRGGGAAGELAFLTIAADLMGSVRSGSGTVELPFLLSLSGPDPQVRLVVAAAWRETLNGRLFHADAQSILGRWAQLAEPLQAARSAIALLLSTAAAGHDRTARIVRRLATDWASVRSETYAPQTADAVLRAVR
jgi:hypothetical protein